MTNGEMRDEPVPEAESPPQKPDEQKHIEEGYGHPAHRPDPTAKYGFDPGPRRTLAVDPRKRWR